MEAGLQRGHPVGEGSLMGTPYFGRGGLGPGIVDPRLGGRLGPLTCPPVGTWARAALTVLAAFAVLIWVVLKPARPH